MVTFTLIFQVDTTMVVCPTDKFNMQQAYYLVKIHGPLKTKTNKEKVYSMFRLRINRFPRARTQRMAKDSIPTSSHENINQRP